MSRSTEPVLACPTVSGRQAGLELRLQPAPARQPSHVVAQTTGLKGLGAGEWTVRKHGAGKGTRRTRRKLHLCVDETTKDIAAVDLTASAVHDSPHLPAVLDRVEGDAGQVSGDRAYDSGTCYEAMLPRAAVPTIPARRNARLSREKDPTPFHVGSAWRMWRRDPLPRVRITEQRSDRK